jgi:replicative DNA helicase
MSESNGHHGSNGHPGRIPALDHDVWPANVKMEESVIGAVLMDPDSIHEVAGTLKPEHFWRASLGETWRTILELYSGGVPIDGMSVAEAMTRAGTFDDIDGHVGLAGFMERVPSAANIRHYAAIVREKWFGRELKGLCRETASKVESMDQTVEEVTEDHQSSLARIMDETSLDRVDTRPFSGVNSRSLAVNPTESGILTGLGGVDILTDGIKPEQLVVVAARPSLGKTALSLNVLKHSCLVLRKPTLMLSLEMTSIEIRNRLIVAESGVPSSRFRNLDDDETDAVDRACHEWDQAPIYISDTPSVGIMGILAMTRRWKARAGIKLLIVDYLQLVRGDGSNRQEEIASISRGLKMVARECHVGVLCLAQLNRQVEAREDKRPRLSDLRESGAIENDADIVMLMHRPDYYRVDDRPGYCEVIVAKNRNGPTGSAELNFDRSLGLFTPWEVPSFDESQAEF